MRLKQFSLSVGIQMYKCFGEEARVRIINLLYQKDKMCTADLELILDFTQTKTSRHLAYLKNAGLLQSIRIDQWTFYSIKEELKDIIHQLLQYLSKDATLLKDIEIYDILNSNRELSINKIDARKWNRKTINY